MIRIEQRVSSHIGKSVHYRSTQYYRSLEDPQKRAFEKYLKHKGKKLFFFSSLAFLSLLGLGGITGNIVLGISNEGLRISSLLIILICLIGITSILISFYHRKKRHKRLSSIHHLIGKTLGYSGS